MFWNICFLAIEIESKPDDQYVVLRERVSAIRRWLKDQYMLYRDYCTMAQAINAHYVPTTLDDAKKVGAFLFNDSMLFIVVKNVNNIINILI